MTKIASRLQSLAPSMTVAIDTKAKDLQAAGLDVVGLGAGEPDFDTPDFIKKAGIESIEKGQTKYTPPTGLLPLKKAVAAKLQRENGLEYDASQIVITSGAKHAIFNAFLAVLEPGDEVVLPAPYWVTYPELAKLCGANPVYLQTSVDKGYKITPDELRAAITPKTKLFILCNPSNPTGMVYDEATLREFAKICVEKDVLVLADEIYEHIVYDGRKVASIASFGPEIKERTLLVNGVSKAYAMTGWRIGYVAAAKPLAAAIGNLQSQATHHPANASQFASIAAYEGGLDFVHMMVEEFTRRRNYIVGALQAIPGVRCVMPEGAFYALPDVSSFYGKSHEGGVIKGSLDLCSYLLEKHLLAVVPGIAFGDDRSIRLSYATSMKNLEKAMERLRAGLSALK